jgi:D-alanyl-D-alanine carboxypeptidase/D-alanyl-D-alanine-endopeptidase (penicillin-binding protein 4)
MGHEVDQRGPRVDTLVMMEVQMSQHPLAGVGRGASPGPQRATSSTWTGPLLSLVMSMTVATAASAGTTAKAATRTATSPATTKAAKTTSTTTSKKATSAKSAKKQPTAAMKADATAGVVVGDKTARAKAEKAPRPVRLVSIDPSVPEALATAITTSLNVESLDGVDVGFIAMDLETGTVLAESGADALINPASNAKMVTSSAALATLKPEYRFKTEYYANGPIKDGVLYGNLVVKGYGDPSITSERLVKVANELYLMGVERITGSVIVDDSWFDSNEEARGWELEEAPDRAYAAPVSAVSVNFNAVAVYLRPGSGVGSPARVVVDPPTERVVLRGEVMTEAVGRGVRLVSQKNDEETIPGRPHDGTLLTIEGSMGVRDAPARIYRRVYDPTRHFGSVLTSFLQSRGVKMRHNVVKGEVPAGSRMILVDKSRPLKEVVDDLMHYSNNILAEALIKQMGAEVKGAPGTFENGLAVARDYLETVVGFAPGSYIFENGSGLNDVNRITARQLAQLTRHVSQDYEIATEWFTSMAVAGTQGTIGFRMKDTPAKRRLRAKTGTLRGVSALSGTVVRPSGSIVAFSILTQGYKTGASPMWKVQNALGTALASDGLYDPDAKEDVEDGEAVTQGLAPGVVEFASGG